MNEDVNKSESEEEAGDLEEWVCAVNRGGLVLVRDATYRRTSKEEAISDAEFELSIN